MHRIFLAVAILMVGETMAWAPLASTGSLPSLNTLKRCRAATSPLMQEWGPSNAGEALKRLGETKAARVALSKFESYTVKLKKPMGLVFEEFGTVAKGLYIADRKREATNPDNLRPYSDEAAPAGFQWTGSTAGCPFDEIGNRDTLIRVNDLQGKETDARCMDFDTTIALIAESESMELELTFAATG